MRRWRPAGWGALAALAALALLAGPAAAAAPLRVVSLVPSLTEAVCLLERCHWLVGTDRYSNWPAEVKGLPKLGGLDDVSLEALLALKPDVVLMAPSSRVRPRLEALGLTVWALPTESHAQVQQAIARLGSGLQASAQAQALWARVQGELDEAARRVPPRARGLRVYMEVSSEPHAAGPGSFIGHTLQRLGLENIVPAEMGAFPRLNPEFVVRAQPQLVVASARQFESMAQRPGWSALKAVHSTACRFDPEVFEVMVRPGPRLGEAALLLAGCVNRAVSARP